jgi:hypothetical protein
MDRPSEFFESLTKSTSSTMPFNFGSPNGRSDAYGNLAVVVLGRNENDVFVNWDGVVGRCVEFGVDVEGIDEVVAARECREFAIGGMLLLLLSNGDGAAVIW